jgi:putative FmdB family regulatory protein
MLRGRCEVGCRATAGLLSPGGIIPIYEYTCQGCGESFEALVLGGEVPKCPSCGSVELDRRISLPSVRSEGTRSLAMRAAKKRDQKQAAENIYTQRQFELNHDD